MTNLGFCNLFSSLGFIFWVDFCVIAILIKTDCAVTLGRRRQCFEESGNSSLVSLVISHRVCFQLN